MALLNDLKQLGTALPPSERVASGEFGDVLSALIAVEHHGEDILAKLKEEGTEGVYTFLHDSIVKQASADGVDAPIRGATGVAPAAPVTPQADGIDYDKLAAAMVKAQAAYDAPPAQTSDVPVQVGEDIPATPGEGEHA